MAVSARDAELGDRGRPGGQAPLSSATGTIGHDVFNQVWERLCQRFNRKLDVEEARSYLRYLQGVGMTVDRFVTAASQLWAIREFFPRPADFLLVDLGREWRQLQRVIDAYDPPHGWDGDLWDGMGIAGQEAVRFLGGLRSVKDQMQLNPSRLFERFRHAYELVVIETSATTHALGTRDREHVLPHRASVRPLGGDRR